MATLLLNATHRNGRRLASRRLGRALTGLLIATLLALGACDSDDDPATAACPATWGEAFDATDGGWLLSVWGPGDGTLYAAGGNPTTGRLTKYDGSSWAQESVGVDVPLLNWVHGFAADDMVVVGNDGTALHRSASGWTKVDTPTDQDLWGVWGASSTDLWAVGGNGREAGDATILRYDGTAWTSVALPTLQRPNVFAIFKVWGTAADNIYFVGQRGVVLRWDGTALSEILVGFDGTAQDLIALWGTGPNHIVAVGGRNNGVIARWNGTDWKTKSVAPLPGLNGIWMRSDTTFHVVGVQGTLAAVDFDSLDVTETTTDVFDDFHAVFGDSRGCLTTVGGNFVQQNGPYRGVAWHRSLASGE